MGSWVNDVSLMFLVFFVLWVLWGVLQYGFNRESDDRSEDAGSPDAYTEKRWGKRSTLS